MRGGDEIRLRIVLGWIRRVSPQVLVRCSLRLGVVDAKSGSLAPDGVSEPRADASRRTSAALTATHGSGPPPPVSTRLAAAKIGTRGDTDGSGCLGAASALSTRLAAAKIADI
jgi:hypothetical protein